MDTVKKQKEHLQKDMQKNVFVRAMAELLFNYSTGTITVPDKYRDKVIEVKNLLKSDTSGIVNSLIDFAITCAQVDYSVETDNANLTELFNDWLTNINAELRGSIPTGINALAKEYFRERWKGSSFLLLRSVWEKKDGFIFPTKLWFVNGEDIIIDDKSIEGASLGNEKYFLKLNKNDQLALPHSKSEKIFVQKPYESWGTTYPTPFIIRRGIYKNLKMLDAMTTKSEYVITKALEYLLLLKKGTEKLAETGNPDYAYSADDLKKIKDKLEQTISEKQYSSGVPTYASQFDTEITHLIPEYEKALKQELYSPMERRLLAGLGLIDVLQGVSSTRRESTLNPRPFITEVESGIMDFKSILNDILVTIIDLNKSAHPKYVGSIRKIHNTPISQFVTDDMRVHFRSMYDKGVISKQTYMEVVGDCDLLVEYNRRKAENDKEIVDVFYPPVIVNEEQYLNADKAPVDKNGNKIPDDKKGTEKKNYKAFIAVYNNLVDLPEEVKNSLSVSAQKLWMKIYNENASEGNDFSSKVAWGVIKKLYKKTDNSWVLKSYVKSSTGRFELSEDMMDSSELDLELKRLQIEISKKLLKEE